MFGLKMQTHSRFRNVQHFDKFRDRKCKLVIVGLKLLTKGVQCTGSVTGVESETRYIT